jgi:hypothetical protein
VPCRPSLPASLKSSFALPAARTSRYILAHGPENSWSLLHSSNAGAR